MDDVYISKLQELINTPMLWELTDQGSLVCRGLSVHLIEDSSSFEWWEENRVIARKDLMLLRVDLDSLKSKLRYYNLPKNERALIDKIDKLPLFKNARQGLGGQT